MVQVHPQDLKEEANHHFAAMVGCNTDQIPLRFPEIGDVLLCIVDKTFPRLLHICAVFRGIVIIVT